MRARAAPAPPAPAAPWNLRLSWGGFTTYTFTRRTVLPIRASLCALVGGLALSLAAPRPLHAQLVYRLQDCPGWSPAQTLRHPTSLELRCRWGVHGPGRFGLLSYGDVPVYQTVNPLPGTHVIGYPGLPRPAFGESYEQWEWRVLRASFGPEARRVYRGTELLHPEFHARLRQLETGLREAGIRATRRETFRTAERQAFLFQQGRSRGGPLATATLTSWHSTVDEQGRPAGRAADYDVAPRDLPRFHAVAHAVGLESFGADSFDPGHVFLPGTGALPFAERALLRLLPRVPHVTLATGRPSDERPDPDALAAYRLHTRAFAAAPFVAYPAPHLVLPARRTPWVAWVRHAGDATLPGTSVQRGG